MTMQNTLTANNAVYHGHGHYSIESKDAKKLWTIHIVKDAKYPDTGTVWNWKVDGQYFSKDEWAAKYLKRLVLEKNTGERIFKRKRGIIPDLCGDGRDCRAKLRNTFTMLCSYCPLAEQMQAEQDGVKLVYDDTIPNTNTIEGVRPQ